MPRTLLLADPSVTMRKVVEMSFASEDVVVITADSGDEAIARARSERPDVVLVSIGIPGTDGYTVCQTLKSDPELQAMPVLLLTGTFEPFDEARAQEVRADGRIMKPFESHVLVEQVNALLDRSAAASPMSDATTAAGDANPPEDAFDFFDDDLDESAAAPAVVAVEDDAPAQGIEPLEIEPEEELTADAPETPAAELGSDEESTRALFGAPTSFDSGSDWREDETAGAGRSGGQPDGGTDDTTPPAPRDPQPAPYPHPFGVDPHPEETFFERTDENATRVVRDEPDFPAPHAPDPEPPAEPDDEEAFAFDFAAPPELEPAERVHAADDPLAGLEPDDLAGEAVLDPDAAHAHEVSSSDLGEPLTDPALEPRAPEPAESTPTSPTAGLGPNPGEASIPPAAPFEEPPAGATRPDPAPPAPEPSSASAPPPAPGAHAPALSPAVRAELHATLEKQAWEALGDVSERIVREAVERIEAVAWEVIPQMAEVLIREEIRRLKGEDTE